MACLCFLTLCRMPFIDMVIEDMLTIGDAALDTSSPFDEAAVLHEVRFPPYIHSATRWHFVVFDRAA